MASAFKGYVGKEMPAYPDQLKETLTRYWRAFKSIDETVMK
jgi:hypothetical protein